MNNLKLYVQYGSGINYIESWINFDSSLTLRIQKIPLLGKLLRSRLNCVFDDEILFGDIVKGLPVDKESVDGLFCSHILEHLSLDDFYKALQNSFSYLKPGGVFRIILPDLESYIDEYKRSILSKDLNVKTTAAINFCDGTCLGRKKSRATLLARIYEAFENNRHQWMWDYSGFKKSLTKEGFVNIKRFIPNESEDPMFLLPERNYQFNNSIAIECRKPFIGRTARQEQG